MSCMPYHADTAGLRSCSSSHIQQRFRCILRCTPCSVTYRALVPTFEMSYCLSPHRKKPHALTRYGLLSLLCSEPAYEEMYHESTAPDEIGRAWHEGGFDLSADSPKPHHSKFVTNKHEIARLGTLYRWTVHTTVFGITSQCVIRIVC